MADAIGLVGVRLSFPKLVEAEINPKFPNSEKKFQCNLILEQNDPNFQRLLGEAGKLAQEKWKEMYGAVMQQLQADKRNRFWGSGAEKFDSKTGKPYQGYEGKLYVACSANEEKPPVIVKPDGTYIDNANVLERQEYARKLYAGCYVNAAVSVWLQDNQFGRAIRCNLLAIQFAKDGEPMGDSTPDFKSLFQAVPGASGAPAAPFPAFTGMPQQPQAAAPVFPKMPWEA